MLAEVSGTVTLGSAQTRGLSLYLRGLKPPASFFRHRKGAMPYGIAPVDQLALESVLTGALSSKLVTKSYHGRGRCFNHQAALQTFW